MSYSKKCRLQKSTLFALPLSVATRRPQLPGKSLNLTVGEKPQRSVKSPAGSRDESPGNRNCRDGGGLLLKKARVGGAASLR